MHGEGCIEMKAICFNSNGTVTARVHGECKADPKVSEKKDFLKQRMRGNLKKADSIFRTARAYQTRAEHITRSGKAEKPISHDKILIEV
jgi:hypothetical protein